jgi:hypothetical protein
MRPWQAAGAHANGGSGLRGLADHVEALDDRERSVCV